MTKEKPTVSAIIPTYNRADLVASAIQSAIDQTYKDIEIIVVDDGSTDNTEEVVKEFVNRDNRVRYIKHDKNKGGSAARNTGIRNARGDYIAFLDSDDQWLPEKLEKQIEFFEKNNDKLGAVGTGAFLIMGHETRVLSQRGPLGDIYKKLLKGDLLGRKKYFPGGTYTLLVKKECLNEIGLFDEQLKSMQDFDIIIRIAKEYHIDMVREPLVKVQLNVANRISLNQEATLEGRKRILEKYSKEIPKISVLRSNCNREIGNILYSQRNITNARIYFFKAVASYPHSLKNWKCVIKSFLPYKFLQFLSSNRKQGRF